MPAFPIDPTFRSDSSSRAREAAVSPPAANPQKPMGAVERWILGAKTPTALNRVLDKILRDARTGFPDITEEDAGEVSLVVVKDGPPPGGTTLKWRAELIEFLNPRDRRSEEFKAFSANIKHFTAKEGNEASAWRARAANNANRHFGLPAVPVLWGTVPLQLEDGSWKRERVVALPRYKNLAGDLNPEPVAWTAAQRHGMILTTLLHQWVLGNNDLHVKQFKGVESAYGGLFLGDVDAAFLSSPEEMTPYQMKKFLGLSVVAARSPGTLWNAFAKNEVQLNLELGATFAQRLADTTRKEWKVILRPMLEGLRQQHVAAGGYAVDGDREFEHILWGVEQRAKAAPEAWAALSARLVEAQGRPQKLAERVSEWEDDKYTYQIVTPGSRLDKAHLKRMQRTAKAAGVKYLQPGGNPNNV